MIITIQSVKIKTTILILISYKIAFTETFGTDSMELNLEDNSESDSNTNIPNMRFLGF